jgi:hypothetical protein
MFHRCWVLLLIAAGLCLPTFGTTTAQPHTDRKKKTAEQAAEFVYPGSKKLKEFNAVAIYQVVLATEEGLPKVGDWYEKKLGGFAARGLLGVSVGGDLSRRSVFQDGAAALPELGQRPVAVRSCVVKRERYTIAVVLSRPPGEKLTVIAVTYIPVGGK